MAEHKRRRGRRVNGEGSVYQWGDRGTWVAQVPVGINPDGIYRFKRYTCATQAAAKAQLRAAQDALDRGADLGAKTQTLGAYLDARLADVVKRDVEPKTYEGYAYTVGLLTPALGRVPLDKLTPQHVQRCSPSRRRSARSSMPWSGTAWRRSTPWRSRWGCAGRPSTSSAACCTSGGSCST
ncbi:MAG TPA: hypothetical protein VFW96_26395 [Thermomicrobiales bacterium]|nr:hypothetical protein [Thermomicrobiales bacterium]